LWNNSVDNTAGNVWSGIRFTGSTGDYETAEIKGWRVHPGTTLNSLSINTGGVERMVLSSGGVGIGTDNINAQLQVNNGLFGLEFNPNSQNAVVSYNRTTSAYAPVGFQGSTVALRIGGSGTALLVDTDGEVTKPLQPLAVIGTNVNNWAPTPGDNLPFNVVETNIGNHYDTSTYKFTCPVAGNYMVILNFASTRWVGDLELRRNDVVIRTLELRAVGVNNAGDSDWAARSYSFIIPCTVGQTLHWRCPSVYTSIASSPYLLDGQSSIGGVTVYTRYDSATYYLMG